MNLVGARRALLAGGSKVLARDSFNRANGALGTADSGQAWTVLNNLQVVSNQAAITVSDNAVFRAVLETGKANVDVRASVASWNDASKYYRSGLALRYVDVNNYWECYLDNRFNQLVLAKVVAGSTVTVATPALSPVSGQFYALRVVARGDTFSVYLDNVLQYAFTDSFDTTGTQHGIIVVPTLGPTTTPAIADDFVVYQI